MEMTSEEFRRLNRLAGGKIERADLELLDLSDPTIKTLHNPQQDQDRKEATDDPEDTLQIQCVEWFREAFPGVLIYHVPNGGKRNPREAAKLKSMGVVPGIPDLHIPEWLYVIELKKKGGRLSGNQSQHLQYYQDIGWRTAVCWSLKQFKSACIAQENSYE